MVEKVLYIKSVIDSEYAVSTDDAEKVAKLIKDALNRNEIITISFKDIKVVISAFLNVAIGDLFADYTKKQIDTIKFNDFQENTIKLIDMIKETAEKFYKEKNDNL